MKKIAVFASGNGSNFQSLVDAEKAGRLVGHIQVLISDKPDAYVNVRAKKENVPVFSFEPKQYTSKADYETVIVEILKEMEIELIVLAGYMRLIGPTLLKSFPYKIINLHPSLLPAFPGLNAIGQAIEYGVKFTGVTVHFVDEGMDTGPIITQRTVAVTGDDDVDTLSEKIHQVEHQLLPETVNLILANKISINKRRVLINEN
ncbi:phosphoribosylglycinamide formyltransferase [Vulcanibacillus modesticaldus]|uniref:Phosphoribosylglycinamide formyltransferase n=1 Tax=Vulcanibacillus modesticaldus TaxID=337097 RepID=A0A1D2YUX0_9BACI|nr:phosphoribosylglycinamide formyltransferase [Vulcanibacillus modesticaldus]OEF99473.1 phosphoribosylglycinamide formyltransferase [Vulcanibacillus modesticaldus]